ncbi:MAG TPA: hypothetical protein VII49_09160, partial [Rhizomicrobium sp.]
MNDVDDPGLAQLGWYVRNCALSPLARRLERALLDQINRLKGLPEDPSDDSDIFEEKRPRARSGELRRALKPYHAAPAGDGLLDRHANYARKEFRLDPLEVEILLLLMRYAQDKRIEDFM